MKWVKNLKIDVDDQTIDVWQWDFKELTNQGTNTDWLESGDMIASFTTTITPSGPTLVSETLTNTNTSLNVGLNFKTATVGTTYKVNVHVVNSDGSRETDRPVYFYVYNK